MNLRARKAIWDEILMVLRNSPDGAPRSVIQAGCREEARFVDHELRVMVEQQTIIKDHATYWSKDWWKSR